VAHLISFFHQGGKMGTCALRKRHRWRGSQAQNNIIFPRIGESTVNNSVGSFTGGDGKCSRLSETTRFTSSASANCRLVEFWPNIIIYPAHTPESVTAGRFLSMQQDQASSSLFLLPFVFRKVSSSLPLCRHRRGLRSRSTRSLSSPFSPPTPPSPSPSGKFN